MNLIKTKTLKLKTKRVFLRKGTCSHTFFHILNREFGHPLKDEERAIDPLAGGIVQQGYQCGMLWGASMAVGAEALRRHKYIGKATASAIVATQYLMNSFKYRTKCIECEDLTKTNFKNKWSFAKYMFSGKFLSCYELAEKWAPEAIAAANEGLSVDYGKLRNFPMSCASELIKKIGGPDEEVAMVAGFAGGLGLSGNGCGALAAIIWKTIFELVKKGEWKPKMSDSVSESIIQKFYKITDYKIECREICGQNFRTIDEHSEYVKNGGCNKLISLLAME